MPAGEVKKFAWEFSGDKLIRLGLVPFNEVRSLA